MKISGFSYIRNGFTYGYPFLQSIQSVLPLCSEFVIAVGDSTDGTREAIVALNDERIKIIDTVWDENMRTNGKIFAQQANLALRETSGDWLFYIQADEVIHEKDLETIRQEINSVNDDEKIEGLLFDFLNFYGSYDYLNDTRYQHLKEIRVFRNGKQIYSCRDSQGVRRYPSWEALLGGDQGIKVKVKQIPVPVFHYNYVRTPSQMRMKAKHFESFWHDDSYLEEKYSALEKSDMYNLEKVKRFEGAHPALMLGIISQSNLPFDPVKHLRPMTLKEKLVYGLDALINHRIGESRNYIIIK